MSGDVLLDGEELSVTKVYHVIPLSKCLSVCFFALKHIASDFVNKYIRKSYIFNSLVKCNSFNKACVNGTYGNNCVYNCSGNCLNDSPCNRQTGYCEGGCKPGYTNAFCNERM